MNSRAQITCSKCGAQVPLNRMYCDECGSEIEHDPNEVQASVDLENRLERLKNIARTIRWFLAASLVLTIGGCYFRKAYRDLPENDVVAYATAPTVAVSDESCVGTTEFLVPLPELKAVPAPKAVDETGIYAKLIEDAVRRATVTVKKRGTHQAVKALLVGDLVFFLPVAGKAEPVPVHLADVRRIRPLGQNRWEIEARNVKDPAQITFAKPSKVLIKILERRDDGKEIIQSIPIDQITDLRPL